MNPSYVVGLDLGQAQDFTALAIVEIKWPDFHNATRNEPVVAVRHLERFPLGTSYTYVCQRISGMLTQTPLEDAPVIMDRTGVGRPVFDMLVQGPLADRVHPVTITAGEKGKRDGEGGSLVPKKELILALQRSLAGGRLLVAPGLTEAETLLQELMDFQVRITSAGNETFRARRQATHDDLVIAVGLAIWEAERRLSFVVNLESEKRSCIRRW